MPRSSFVLGLFLPLLFVATATTLPAHSFAAIPGPGNTGGNPTIPGPGNTGVTNGGPATGQTIANPLKASDLQSLLLDVLKAIQEIGTILLTLAIIFVGFQYVRAQGNPGALQKAHQALLWTIIGGLILLGATGIGMAIQSTANAISS